MALGGRPAFPRPRTLLLLGLGSLLIVFAWLGLRANEASLAYTAAMGRLDGLRLLARTDAASMSPASLTQARSDFQELRIDFQRLDAATALPAEDWLVGPLPWVGSRYTAARNLVRIGLLATDAGSTAIEVSDDVVRALDSSGVGPSKTGKPTWLDVLTPHQEQVAVLAQDIRSIQAIRPNIDEQILPERARAGVQELDRFLARPEVQLLSSLDLPAALSALGGSTPTRYLVVFQNPAELRPTGGFPGTMALVTLDRGQLQSYEFFDAHTLTDAYVSHRAAPLAQPWPIARFFPQNGFLLHDALWWPDFPRSAQQLMAMYSETGWSPIQGIIAVQPEVASDLLRITGSFSIDFEGEQRHITADNLYAEIQRQRRLQSLVPEDQTVHKDMLSLIGKNLIERLKTADRRALLGAVQEFASACAQRNLQVYSADLQVQAQLDRHACTGRLQPPGNHAVLAVTYANLALSKNSLDMRPSLAFTADRPVDGHRVVKLDIQLRDGAVAEEDPTYAGFQRWWVEVQLPEGSTLLSDRGPMEDPDAPNGGSYLAELFPDITGRINVRFSMPDTPSLLIHRQPGVRPGDVTVSQVGCESQYAAELDRDLVVELGTLCG